MKVLNKFSGIGVFKNCITPTIFKIITINEY